MRSRSNTGRGGFVLVTMSAGALAMTGVLGMAFDIGRMYIAKSELQTFADAAALAGTLRLNGQSSGIPRAGRSYGDADFLPVELQQYTADVKPGYRPICTIDQQWPARELVRQSRKPHELQLCPGGCACRSSNLFHGCSPGRKAFGYWRGRNSRSTRTQPRFDTAGHVPVHSDFAQ